MGDQIVSDRRTAAAFSGLRLKGFPSDVLRRAQKRLRQLEQRGLCRICDCRRATGWRLLSGSGEVSTVRINDQWRIGFVWQEGDAYEVEMVDYH